MRATVKSTIAEVKNNLAVVGGKVAEVKKLLSVVKGVIVEAWSAITGYHLTGWTLSTMNSSSNSSFEYKDIVNSTYATRPGRSSSANVKVVSPSGRYAITSGSDTSGIDRYESFVIYRYDEYTPTSVQTLAYNADFFTPSGVTYLSGWSAVRFSPDDRRIAFVGYWEDDTSTTDYQYGIMFLKLGSDGLYSYEKKVVLFSDTISSYPFQYIKISNDLSTVIGIHFDPDDSSILYAKIFKGSPDSGYTQIYNYKGTSATLLNVAFDEEKAEYVLFGSMFLYINGTTVTKLSRPSKLVTTSGSRLVFNGDRTLMYVSYYYGGANYIRSFSISNKITFTYLGDYSESAESIGKHIICDHAGQSNKAIVCFWGGTSGSEEYILAYCTLSKDDTGAITGRSTRASDSKYYQIYAIDSSYVYIEATRFINRAEQ